MGVGWIHWLDGSSRANFALLKKDLRLNAVPFVPHAINISHVCLRLRKYISEFSLKFNTLAEPRHGIRTGLAKEFQSERSERLNGGSGGLPPEFRFELNSC